MTISATRPDQILRIALEREKQARDFYAQLAQQVSVDFVKELLETLENEESKHIHMVEKMLDRLEFGKGVSG